MFNYRRAVSVFIAWHIVAMCIGAIPSPIVDPLPALPLSRHVSDDRMASSLAPVLDAAVERFIRIPAFLIRALRPVRPAVDLYLYSLHLEQRWSMFANPPQVDQYLRLRYFVSSTDGRQTWSATELVLPASNENHVRLVRSYFDSARDKALAIAYDDFTRNVNSAIDRTGTRPDPLPEDLAPIERYFARRFERERVEPGTRVTRIETWYGEVLNPSRGHTIPDATVSDRKKVLDKYYEGPIRSTGVLGQSLWATEREADIAWKLLFVENR
jgi:hypothetical protein